MKVRDRFRQFGGTASIIMNLALFGSRLVKTRFLEIEAQDAEIDLAQKGLVDLEVGPYIRFRSKTADMGWSQMSSNEFSTPISNKGKGWAQA
jgi:hypothetical protein